MGQRKRRQEEELSRRQFVQRTLYGAAALGISALGVGVYRHASQSPFEEAFDTPEKREQWTRTLPTKPYANILYGSPQVLAMLRTTKQYTPPEGAFAVTIPVDENKVAQGTQSMLVILPEVFNPKRKHVTEQLNTILENMVVNHELIHAAHFYSGIPGFDKYLQKPDGSIDGMAFTATSEVIANLTEAQSLARKNDNHPYIQEHIYTMREIGTRLLQHESIQNKKDLAQKLEQTVLTLTA